MRSKRDFFLLKDGRWTVRFEWKYCPIFLPGPPYERRPGAVTRQELKDIGFYEPRDSKSNTAMFIGRNASEVLVFFVPRNEKTCEMLHSNGKWFFVNTNEPIPSNQIAEI